MSDKITSPEQALKAITAAMYAGTMLGVVSMTMTPLTPEMSESEKKLKSDAVFNKIETRNAEIAKKLLEQLEEFFRSENTEIEEKRLQAMAGAPQTLHSYLGTEAKAKLTSAIDAIVHKHLQTARENIMRDCEASRVDKVA